MGEVNSIQILIKNFLLENFDRGVVYSKKGYRTYCINGRELAEKINKTRILLLKQGIKKADKIIILGANSIEWIIIYFACILSGIIVVPLDILTDRILLRKIQKQVNAKAIFYDKSLSKSVNNLSSINKAVSINFINSNKKSGSSSFSNSSNFSKIKRFYLDELDDVLEDIKVMHIPKVRVNPKDILEIIYTSGTTSEPKGVILTHENLTVGVNAAVELIPLKIKLKVLNLPPLSHIFGQVYGLFFLMYFNHKIFFIDSIQPKKIISFIKNKKINGIVLVPGILASLKKELKGKSVLFNLGAQFRLIGVGGASLEPELEKWWKKHLITVVQGYGLTETSAVISGNKIMSKTGSVGMIAGGVDVKLGKDKEILIKGKNVFPGYFKDKEKTKQAFENNWFKTGDIGIIKNNYLYIKERKKDIIITGSGLNVYPIDIEKVLNKMPSVKESCVLEKDGKIHAILILNKKVIVSNIIKEANEKLLSHQKITSYSIWPDKDFPKTPLGKIKKYLVLQEINKLKTPRPYSYENKLFDVISNVLKPSQKINLKSKLSDLGMDSLKRVELISELEKEFDVEIDETKINQNTRVSDMGEIMKQDVEKIKFKKWPINPLIKLIRIIFQKILFYPLASLYAGTEYSGAENLNLNSKPAIFVSNHQSVLDVPTINKILSKNSFKTAIPSDSAYVFGIGIKEKLSKRLYEKLRGFCTALFYNGYPFGETIGTDKSLEFTGEFIDLGYSIIFFPEGQRTRNGKMNKFKSGIGYLALNMKVPIIPIKIEGLFEIMPAGRYIIPKKFGKSKVKFGKPITLDELKGLSYISATKLIEEKVKGL